MLPPRSWSELYAVTMLVLFVGVATWGLLPAILAGVVGASRWWAVRPASEWAAVVALGFLSWSAGLVWLVLGPAIMIPQPTLVGFVPCLIHLWVASLLLSIGLTRLFRQHAIWKRLHHDGEESGDLNLTEGDNDPSMWWIPTVIAGAGFLYLGFLCRRQFVSGMKFLGLFLMPTGTVCCLAIALFGWTLTFPGPVVGPLFLGTIRLAGVLVIIALGVALETTTVAIRELRSDFSPQPPPNG